MPQTVVALFSRSLVNFVDPQGSLDSVEALDQAHPTLLQHVGLSCTADFGDLWRLNDRVPWVVVWDVLR